MKINKVTGSYNTIYTLHSKQKGMLQDILCENGLNIDSLFKLTPEQVKTVELVLQKNDYDVSERRFLNQLRDAAISDQNYFKFSNGIRRKSM